MLLLVTGASGIGKTTVRRRLEPQLLPEVECAELWDLAPNPLVQGLRWRQQTVELAVQYAVELQREGRHLLLCGDPIAAVEVASAPSATQLHTVAFCLLDASPRAQTARLTQRGDDPALIAHHHAFADWMRRQASDPTHMLHVVSTDGWPRMRWDRIPALVEGWHMASIDTTEDDPSSVAEKVRTWIRGVLAGSEPSLDLRPL